MTRHASFFHLLILALLLAGHGLALAQPGDVLRPVVSYSLTHDNNIFRTGTNEQDDIYQTLSAGLLLDWRQSRQQVTGRISASRTKFADLTALDFTGYDFLGQWNWQLGNQLSGVLGYSASRSLGSFVDYAGGTGKNTIDRDRAFFSGSYAFHPRWRFEVAAESDGLDYSAPVQRVNERTLDAAAISIDYLTPKGSRVGTYLRRLHGNYPNRQLGRGSLVDNSFEQWETGLQATWELNGKVQLSGRAGQTRRDHDEVPQRDFEGLTARVDANWKATEKLRLGASVYHDIGAVDDVYASYSVNDGLRFNPSWQIGYKLKLDAEVYIERRNFEGDPFLIGVRREDKAKGLDVSLGYQPRDWANLGVSLQAGERESNLFNDYSYRVLSVYAQLVF